MSKALDNEKKGKLKPLRVIVVSMAVGVILLSVIAVVVNRSGSPPKYPHLAVPCLVGLGVLGTLAMVGYGLLRRSVFSRARQSLQNPGRPIGDRDSTVETLAVLMIIGGAMAEGVGLLGAAIYLMTGVPWALIASGVALVALALQYPTDHRFEDFTHRLTNNWS